MSDKVRRQFTESPSLIGRAFAAEFNNSTAFGFEYLENAAMK